MQPPTSFTTGIVVALCLVVSGATVGGQSADPLVEAFARNDRQAIDGLLGSGVDVNGSRPDGTTALMWAAHWDDLDGAKNLIRLGANVNAANDYDVTPLDLACENRNTEMVETLLAAGANVNVVQTNGVTPLMKAARVGSVEIVKTLLDRGAAVDAKTDEGQTALVWAITELHVDVVRQLLAGGADPNVSSDRGFTPLMHAALHGDMELTSVLLEAGAGVNVRGSKGDSALPLAIVAGQDEFALFLLAQGADPDGTLDGVGALHAAVGSVAPWLRNWFHLQRVYRGGTSLGITRRVTLVEALLERGANPNSRIATDSAAVHWVAPKSGAFNAFATGTGNLRGATPLWVAAYARAEGGLTRDGAQSDVYVDAGATIMMRLLLAAGADPNIPSVDGTTPLMVASGLGGGGGGRRRPDGSNPALPRTALLLEHGADVNAVNEADFTALHGAAFSGNKELLRYLVEEGASIDAQDFRGRTPYRIAEGAKQAFGLIKQPEVAEIIKELGADVTLGPSWEVLERQLARQTQPLEAAR